MTEYEVSWSGTIETEAARSRQRHIPVVARHAVSNTDIVLGCLEDNPGASMRVIVELTGLSQGAINGTLYSLLRQGFVERSHRQVEDRTTPVQWRIRHVG